MSGIAFVVKCENILASLYVTRKRSHLTSVQSSVTGLYSVRHSPLLLLTLGENFSLEIFRPPYSLGKICENFILLNLEIFAPQNI